MMAGDLYFSFAPKGADLEKDRCATARCPPQIWFECLPEHCAEIPN